MQELFSHLQAGLLNLAGANSAAGLRSIPIRYLILDEKDAYPGDVEGEGDPSDLAKKRNMIITAGGDFHGTAGDIIHADIGEIVIEGEDLRIFLENFS